VLGCGAPAVTTWASIYHEFEKQLAAGKARWAGRPREEMLDLFLLALEREEIVAIGYRESAIARRLAAMSVPGDVREVVHHALIWAWKDEEMHAIYIQAAGRHDHRDQADVHARLRPQGSLQHQRSRHARPARALPRVKLQASRHAFPRSSITWAPSCRGEACDGFPKS
jgi:hypothetical protein